MEPSREPKPPEVKINSWIFKDHIKQKYKSIVGEIEPGQTDTKVLCADPALLEMIRAAFSKEDLMVNKVFPLKEETRFVEFKHIIFFAYPTVHNMNIITNLIRSHADRIWYIIYVPRRTFDCKEALTRGNVYGAIRGHYEFNFDLYPLDQDILSLEIPDAAKQLYTDLDTTTLVMIAESLQRLQLVFGRFETIIGKGNSVPIILELMKNMENESKIKPDDSMRGEIDACVILPRNADFITPLLTQYIYEGMLDEIFGIRMNNAITLEKKFFPAGVVQKVEGPTAIHRLLNDNIFRDVKDMHLAAVNSVIQEKLEYMSSEDKKATSNTTADKLAKERRLREMGVEDITLHLNLYQHLNKLKEHPMSFKTVRIEQTIIDNESKPAENMEFIETQICKQIPITKALRLLCLQSLVGDGLKQQALDNAKKLFVQSYGFEHILTLTNLEKAGMLRTDGERRWKDWCKQLLLVNPELGDLRYPSDAGFAYEGYTPILCRLVEQLFKKDGWGGIKNTLSEIPGSTIYDEKKASIFSNNLARQTILVYFIGGITYGEIAVLRYLGKKYNKEILIASTSIINGDKFVSQFFEKFNRS